ncbi:MAG: lipid A deacylase LpxR family protein [Ferruginibacter sp.]
MIRLSLAAIILLSFFQSPAQRIDYASSFRQQDAPTYFRFHYDNDYFTKYDKYYTQGITWEFVHPSIRKFPLARLLYRPWQAPAQYGLTFNLFGFTPNSILSDSILYGDRPFDANISLQAFLTQTDTARKRKVSMAISLGVMGPAALGYEIQYNIHKCLDNPLPHGWQYQIKNDIILNYQLGYEKQLLSSGNHFLLNGTAEARIGTLNDKLNTGFNFMAGRFNKRFETKQPKRKAEYYFYGQGRANLIGYDASLQGGLFNRKSPYTITAANISRLSFQADAGVIVNFKSFYLSYTQSFLTKEFSTGSNHRWGGVSLGFAL